TVGVARSSYYRWKKGEGEKKDERNYPDAQSAREELGRYIESYNQSRPHQALFNFTPAHVHQLNNKSVLMVELNEMKRKTREKRKAYWAEKQNKSSVYRGGIPRKGSDRDRRSWCKYGSRSSTSPTEF